MARMGRPCGGGIRQFYLENFPEWVLTSYWLVQFSQGDGA